MSKKKSELNKYFNKIFVINLYNNTKKWDKVNKQFKSRNIKVERFVAVDGRCKNDGKQACMDKLNSFQIAYDVKINPKAKDQIGRKMSLKEILPASSLTIGTLLLLRAQVKNKWKHMLICEDDIELTRNIEKKFKKGIKELGKTKWDLLYLGCGGLCGDRGLSWDKDEKHPHESVFKEIEDFEDDEMIYVSHPNDLRTICDDKRYCEPFSDNITRIKGGQHGGTWCYAWSLDGAKKMVKEFEKKKNEVSIHIDQFINKTVRKKILKAYSFDPVIVHHEKIGKIRNTDIPWK